MAKTFIGQKRSGLVFKVDFTYYANTIKLTFSDNHVWLKVNKSLQNIILAVNHILRKTYLFLTSKYQR